jgi:hydroxyethylthiazole kinase-like sugar kinase family protein
MQIAGRKANALGIPVVLDIVGCGATAARSAAVKELSAGLQLAVIKGNIGEIGAGGGARRRHGVLRGRDPHGLQERAFRQRLRLGPSRANARRPGPGRPEKEG